MNTLAHRLAAYTIALGATLTMTGCESVVGPESGPPCAEREVTLPSVRHLKLTRQDDGLVLHLQRGASNGAPTVRIWEHHEYAGERYVPASVHGISVKLVTRQVYETWMGSVQQVTKQVPVAEFCAGEWSDATV